MVSFIGKTRNGLQMDCIGNIFVFIVLLVHAGKKTTIASESNENRDNVKSKAGAALAARLQDLEDSLVHRFGGEPMLGERRKSFRSSGSPFRSLSNRRQVPKARGAK